MRLSLLLLSAVLLSACARLPAERGETAFPDWQSHRAAVTLLHDWVLQGRVAIQTKKEGWNAGLRWVQRDQAYTMRVIAPLGQGTYELQGGPDGVVMRTADNDTLKAADPESLLRKTLGWPLPVTGLKYWVRGIPDPDSRIDELVLDKNGRLAELRQNGWRIRVQRYMRNDQLYLPVKLSLENAHLSVKLAIQEWSTKPI